MEAFALEGTSEAAASLWSWLLELFLEELKWNYEELESALRLRSPITRITVSTKHYLLGTISIRPWL